MNNPKEVRDFLADRNLPIAVGKNIRHSYRDSGVVTSKLITPILNDYTNRKKHPFNEFPQGIKIITFDATKGDSTTVTGNYALTFTNTKISDIRDDVVIVNHSGDTKLETNQLYWDQKEKVVFTEDGFRLTTATDTITGFGFESLQDLSKWVAKDITGEIITKEDL
ncbi:LPS export ABC transporter periplasmic protein LptC [Tenacibaculum sp. SG-28]|uniref:LPS export ABC transporter periplasmic protein LptC n=1 Tax=Tenacibaculum sp. SG-28 TaxID=754426 RepID=UPI001E2F2560|nr:LPS export ABC transporter periplasmic protein LptC [Tenacibaculum sp. SG-28]